MNGKKPTLPYADAATVQRRRSKLAVASLILNAYAVVATILIVGGLGQELVAANVGPSIPVAFISSLAFAIAARCSKNAHPSLSNWALAAWGFTAVSAAGLVLFILHNMPSC